MAEHWIKVEDEEYDDLKPVRSKAELIRTRNSYIAIAIAAAAWGTNLLVVLRVFGII